MGTAEVGRIGILEVGRMGATEVCRGGRPEEGRCGPAMCPLCPPVPFLEPLDTLDPPFEFTLPGEIHFCFRNLLGFLN